jgi:arylsulfatase A-like enzyme
MYTNRAQSIISKHATSREYLEDGSPLFLYLAMHNVHGPLEAEDRILNQYNESIYATRRTMDAMVTTVDETMANVSASLHKAGLAPNTLIIMTSDNGGPIQEPGGHWSPGNNW